jgi:hypothetical protein
VSAIEVATVLHEQFNWLDSVMSTGLHLANREITRKGLNTSGMEEAVLTGWNRLCEATTQYSEILEPDFTRCQRSGLTSTKSMQLYVSNFDDDLTLMTRDRIFLQAYPAENSMSHYLKDKTVKSQSFVQKAAQLGFNVTPNEQRSASIPTPLYQSDQKHVTSPEFEQINEDMFSRKENKFMVFNGAGVDSWSGSQSITKKNVVL